MPVTLGSGLETREAESDRLRCSTNCGSRSGFSLGDMPRSIGAVAGTACEWIETAFAGEA